MKFAITPANPQSHAGNCLIIGIFEDKKRTPSAEKINQSGALLKILQQSAFHGKIGDTLPLYHLPGTKFQHLLLVGCGKNKNLTKNQFRKVVSGMARALISQKISKAICYLGELPVEKAQLPWKVQEICEIVEESNYRFDLFKSEKEPVYLKELSIDVPAMQQKACLAALKRAQAISAGVFLTKNLANLPSNICTPSFLAAQAKDLAKNTPISVKILDEAAMLKLKMNAILAVTQGSAEEAKLICLEYKGGGKKAPIALVGKGVTFDTGGNSLKPPDSMVGMKYDMCGAATVLGVFKATAQLKLPINLVGVIPCVENMPGGSAYKPEDIITSMSGITIEVISTDAEGRVILADALTYCERYKPDTVIDIATLTGAVVIALGFQTTGLLANDDTLAKELLTAGNESNDRAWQLPLWDEYQEQIKSPFADIANTGGRSAGTITAACFLSRFAKKFKWAHLDVAGTAAMMMGTQERRASGRPVPMLMQFLINRAHNKK